MASARSVRNGICDFKAMGAKDWRKMLYMLVDIYVLLKIEVIVYLFVFFKSIDPKEFFYQGGRLVFYAFFSIVKTLKRLPRFAGGFAAIIARAITGSINIASRIKSFADKSAPLFKQKMVPSGHF